MQLSYGQVEATLAAHFRIHPDRRGTFRSRIKQLQRMEFPAGVNIGRGAKMVYSAEHLFQLVTAFELIQAPGLPAERAVKMVVQNWDRLRAAFGVAYLYIYRGAGPEIFARFIVQSLRELQVSAPHDVEEMVTPAGAESSVIVEDEDTLHLTWNQPGYAPLLNCALMLRCSGLVRRVLTIAQDQGAVEVWNDTELARWLPPPAMADREGPLWLQVGDWRDNGDGN